MKVVEVPISPFQDQRPGTSGLRKRTQTYMQPHYLAAFVQAVFDVTPPTGALVLGGDGRFFTLEALQIIIRIALANGCRHVIVGQDGLLSTPAASHLIRSRGAVGGLILSASHNPGGADGDFGVKFNTANGAPAPEDVTDAIFARTQQMTAYRMADIDPVSFAEIGETSLEGCKVEVVPSAAAYADLMAQLFDFPQIASLLARKDFAMVFDGMSAVTGPYAEEIFCRRLGAPPSMLLRCEPKPDFGGGHPDPNPENAAVLMEAMAQPDGPTFGAASDGDGDRHMVLGRGFHVNPSDSLAILAANATLVPGYAQGLAGVARSMPTSRAVDAVAERLGIKCYETPTGWKYFGSLLDAGLITLCGEESAGAGSNHVREKDGLWAVLFWLNLIAVKQQPVETIVVDHWREFGRHACMRLDYEGLPQDDAQRLMAALLAGLSQMNGRRLGARVIESADSFSYVDPVDGAEARDQGMRVSLSGEGRIVYRLSGTGTSGATLRVYLEQVVRDPSIFERSSHVLTQELEEMAQELAQIPQITGRMTPTHRV